MTARPEAQERSLKVEFDSTSDRVVAEHHGVGRGEFIGK